MMQFTQIPQQYAPLGGELRYAVEQEAAGNIDIHIVDAAADGTGVNRIPESGPDADGAAVSAGDGTALLGAKRFAATAAAAFDIAPYLRRRVRFVPATGGTGFRPRSSSKPRQRTGPSKPSPRCARSGRAPKPPKPPAC